jgi:uncharacterized delta-60 repeat protein
MRSSLPCVRVTSSPLRAPARNGAFARQRCGLEALEPRRLLSAGDLDTRFGGDGTVVAAPPAGADEQGTAAALTAEGKILVAGANTGVTGDFTAVRFNGDGSTDGSLGGGGRVTTDFFGGSDAARAVAALPGGKFLLAGSAARLGAPGDFGLARYNADGSLDTSFGRGGADGDGKVTTDFFGAPAGAGDAARAIAVLPDGKVLLAGFAQNSAGRTDFALARYNPDGSLDTTFGRGGADGDGKVTSDFGLDDEARALAVLPDGKIVLAGHSASADGSAARVALARYTPDGTLDTTFGRGGADGDGKVTTRVAGGDVSFARALAVLPNGRLLVAGHVRDPADGLGLALTRYLADGTLDTSFGVGDDLGGGIADGFTVVFTGGGGVANGVVVTPAGKIVTGGASADGMFASGFNADGSRDMTFERSGWWNVRVGFGGNGASTDAVLLRPTGQIVLAGTAGASGAGAIAVAQLQGSAGDGDADDQLSEAVAAPVGAVLAGRVIDRVTDVDLYRFTARPGQIVSLDVDRPAGGALDAYLRLFNGAGEELAAADNDNAPGEPRGTDPYLEYRFAAAGTYYAGVSSSPNRSYRAVTGDFDNFGGSTGAYDLSISDVTTRAPAPGDLDLTFGGGGTDRNHFGTFDAAGNAGAALPDGRVLVAGHSGNDFLLARYNADGTLDTSFGGGDGFVTTPFAPPGGEINPAAGAEAVAVLPGGKILAIGTVRSSTPGSESRMSIAIARYNADGTLDDSFGRGGPEGDGKVMDRPGQSLQWAAGDALEVLPDGKFLVGGMTLFAPAVVRYNADGTLDTSFGGGDGVAGGVNFFGAQDFGRGSPVGGSGNALALLPGGKILLTGSLEVYETAPDGPGDMRYNVGTLDRFNPDGSPDATFGGGTGRVVLPQVVSVGAAAPLADGRVLAVVPGFSGATSDFAVARFNADGSFDPTFGPAGGEGVARVDFFGGTDFAQSLVTDSAGRILVAGSVQGASGNSEERALGLARLLPDGRLDATFGGGRGFVATDLGAPASDAGARAVFLRPAGAASDGDAVIVGAAPQSVAAAVFVNSPAGAAGRTYEAELAHVTGAAVSDDHAGFSGGGFVDYLHRSGDAIEFTVNAPAAGRYALSFRHANGGSSPRAMGLAVNGAAVPGGVSFAPTGSWAQWRNVTVPVRLAAGANVVRLLAIGQSGPNVDALTVTPLPPTAVTYQAESARLSGPAAAADHGGYGGAGYADYRHANGDYVEFTIDVPAGGTYALEFRYANGGTSNRPLDLGVDGAAATRLSFAPTGGWATWGTASGSVLLGAGRHTVRLTAAGQGGPNLDALTVRSPA